MQLAQEDTRRLIESHFASQTDRRHKFNIEKDVQGGQYYVSAQIAGMIAKVPIHPDDPERWDHELDLHRGARATTTTIQSAMDSSAYGHGNTQFVSGLMDLFMDVDDLQAMYANQTTNTEEAKARFEIARLGPWVSDAKVAQIVFCFPIFPEKELKYCMTTPDFRPYPVLVARPPGTHYRNDFGIGVTQFYKLSKFSEYKRVYMVRKIAYDSLRPESTTYYGTAESGRPPLFQVPDFMIKHWRPMAVKAIDFPGNRVEFYRRGKDSIETTIDSVKPNVGGRTFAEMDQAHKEMALALLDLYLEHPSQMIDFYAPDHVVRTKEYAAYLERQEGGSAPSEVEQQQMPSEAPAAEKIESPIALRAPSAPKQLIASSIVTMPEQERLRRERILADKRSAKDYPKTRYVV